MDVTRRNLIQILGAAAPAAAAAQLQEHAHTPAAEPARKPLPPYQRRVFDDHQWRTVQVLCDLHFGAMTILGVGRRKVHGLELGSLVRAKRPSGLAVEVDPPLAARKDDDEDGSGFRHWETSCSAALEL